MENRGYETWLELAGHPELVAEGVRREELVRSAAALRSDRSFEGPRYLLASEDRCRVAVALLAAAVFPDGPVLVVPYSLSPRVLEEVELAAGARRPQADGEAPRPRVFPQASGKEFLHLYTGGTTGRPMAWAKTRENLFGEARFLAKRFGIGPSDTILAAVPPFHIYGMLFSVLLPMVSGARVVAETPFLPRELEALAARHGATLLVAAPAHFRALAGAEVGIPGLRLAFSSGGFLDEEDGRRFADLSAAPVVEVYGSTETGGIATRCRREGEEDWTPFDVVEWGTEGERLCVRSPFMSADLERREDGMYVTGDRVEPTDRGRFRLLGRADGVVKVGGKRVVLEDVRGKLLGMPGVSDALVIGLPLAGGRETEVVALVAGNGDAASWRCSAAGLLEPAERPRRVVKVASLPLTPAGKLDMEAARRIAEEHSQPSEPRG